MTTTAEGLVPARDGIGAIVLISSAAFPTFLTSCGRLPVGRRYDGRQVSARQFSTTVTI